MGVETIFFLFSGDVLLLVKSAISILVTDTSGCGSIEAALVMVE